MRKIYTCPSERVILLDNEAMMAVSMVNGKDASEGYSSEGGGDGDNDSRITTSNLWDNAW